MKNHSLWKKTIQQHLRRRYQERGRDFYFKSNQLQIGLNPRAIGRLLKELYIEGYILLWSRPTCTSPFTWKTKFGNNGEP